jgi:DNA mismatch repair protein MutS
MAQSGSFVPAAEARIGLVDRIYCRVGASDNLARGESTFLVEMNETAYILNTATEQSLVIMDEVGRGTGTKDGLSIAWAVCEELMDKIKCRTLFATHYHELSGIVHPRMANRSMDVAERDGQIVFLRKIREGPAAESYGLHVAALAGLPENVLSRAGEVMASLSDHIQNTAPPLIPAPIPARKEKPDKAEYKIFEILSDMDTNDLTPLEALNLIHRWKKLVQTKESGGQENSDRVPGKVKNPPFQGEPSLFD